MNKSWSYFIIATSLIACNGNVKTEEKAPETTAVKTEIVFDSVKQVIDTILLSKTDSAFIVKNKPVKDDIGDQQKEYTIHVYFTDKKWPVLTYKNAIGADLVLAGDLNGDNQPELLFRPKWFSNCWTSVNLFSLSNKAWKLMKNGGMYFCSDRYPLAKRVIKTAEGYGLLTDSLANDKFITLKKEIKF